MIITVAVIGWWLAESLSVTTQDGISTQSYSSAIDDAHTAADQLSRSGLSEEVEIYEGVSVPANATALNLSGRQLTGSLKAEIRHLTALQTIDLSSNAFTGVPAEIGQLSELRILDLSNNPLTGLPHELGNLDNLERLDVRGTNASASDVSAIQERLPSTTEVLVD